MSRRLMVYISLTLALIALDCITKQIALALIDPIPLVPGLGLVVAFNHGIAFGLFSKYDFFIQGFSMLVLLGLVVFASKRRLFQHYPVLLWILLFAGGIGNSIDRLLYGHVIDFIKFHIGGFGFIFNLADVYLTLAVVVLVTFDFYKRRKI